MTDYESLLYRIKAKVQLLRDELTENDTYRNRYEVGDDEARRLETVLVTLNRLEGFIGRVINGNKKTRENPFVEPWLQRNMQASGRKR